MLIQIISRKDVGVMQMKSVQVSFNLDDPEQERLYHFLTKLPNGKRRNASGYIKRLVDRSYHTQRPEDNKRILSKDDGGIRLSL